MVMIMSDDEKARTEAFRLISKSGIMKEFPGFEIGYMALEDESQNLMVPGSESSDFEQSILVSTGDTVVGDELPDVFASKEGPIVGARLQARFGKGNERLSHAVAGGIVHYKGRYYIYTVSYFLLPHDVAGETISNTQGSWDATGLSDSEGDSDDEEGDDLVQATSRGSATPESNLSDSYSFDSDASTEALAP